MMITLTNTHGEFTRSLNYLPHGFTEGSTVCNILADDDCVKIEGRSLKVTLVDGEPKVWVPKANNDLFLAE